ncbi:MAG: TatD family hydrolase [Phycisphaerales bacterium]
MLNLTDTHAHLTFEGLLESVGDVLARSRAAGIAKWLTIGTDYEHNEKAVELASKYENLFAIVGIHPHYASEYKEGHLQRMIELIGSGKVVAIGETGLDYHYDFAKQQDQRELFKRLIDIASLTRLPLVIHSRKATEDTLQIIEKYAQKASKIVFHCWSGTAEETRQLIDKGFYVSFTGIITFKNAELAREAVKTVPLNRMMIETDCPYMSPEPMRKQKINEPALMIHTAKKIAELKGVDLETLAEQLEANTKEFFGV